MTEQSHIRTDKSPIPAAIEALREHVETLDRRLSDILYGEKPDLDSAPESSGLLHDIEQIDMIVVGILDTLQL